jgi:hypothetical protein
MPVHESAGFGLALEIGDYIVVFVSNSPFSTVGATFDLFVVPKTLVANAHLRPASTR